MKKHIEFDAKRRWQLTTFVKDHYEAYNGTDGEFAKKAEAALGFPVNAAVVFGARKVLDIPSTKTKAAANTVEVDANFRSTVKMALQTMRGRIAELESLTEKQGTLISKLYKEFSLNEVL